VPCLSPNRWFFIFLVVYFGLLCFNALVKMVPGNNFLKENLYFGGLLFYPAVLFLVSLVVLKEIGVNFKAALLDWAANFKTDVMLGVLYFGIAALLAWAVSAAGLERFLENSRATEIDTALIGRPFLLYAMMFSVVVLAPVGEEIFFKRLLYVGLRQEMPVLKAVLLSSFLFVLLHPAAAFLPMIIFVPVTYYIYEKHKRLSINIILHSGVRP